jgi:hypothetical protein
MAIAQVHELSGMTSDTYQQAIRELKLSGPPPGSLVHLAGPMEGGWRIIEVWESEQTANAFYGSAQFQQMTQRLGVPQPNITSWPIENVLK